MSDVNCPYCGAGQEICHDNGYGYEENQIHEQECRSCDKVFAYTTSIIFLYESRRADCLNGEQHRYQPTKTWPREMTKMQCDDCGKRRPCTKAEWADIKVSS